MRRVLWTRRDGKDEEDEGISHVAEGGSHDGEARRSKVCLGKRGGRRAEEEDAWGGAGGGELQGLCFRQKTFLVPHLLLRSMWLHAKKGGKEPRSTFLLVSILVNHFGKGDQPGKEEHFVTFSNHLLVS